MISLISPLTDDKHKVVRMMLKLKRSTWQLLSVYSLLIAALLLSMLLAGCAGELEATAIATVEAESSAQPQKDEQTPTNAPPTNAPPANASSTNDETKGVSTESEDSTENNELPQLYTYRVVASYPHDPNAFTQGLLFDQGVLYEGTGLYGESTLRRVTLATGTVEQQISLPAQYFGEGITIVGDRIFQLTWRENTGFIYDKNSFEQLAQFTYRTEGWGITYDGSYLIVSDGSDRLYFLDPESQQVVQEIAVTVLDPTDQVRKGVVRLNELEYIDGEIYANIWQTDTIVRIQPESGNVTGVINLAGLLPAADRRAGTDVLNGIAYLPNEKRLFVTGKKWPKLFEIELVEQ